MKKSRYCKFLSLFLCLLLTFGMPIKLTAASDLVIPESSSAIVVSDAPELTEIAEDEGNVPADTDSVSAEYDDAPLPVDTESTVAEYAEVSLPEDTESLADESLSEVPFAIPEELVGAVPANPFKDVSNPAHPFYEAVCWARANGIAKGYTGKNIFGVNDPCTRGQAVCFLWRMAGMPAPQKTSNPFRDISSGDAYYKAILWAYGKGIAKGYPDGRFGRNEPCTRGQVATFLWRYYGMAEVVMTRSPFADEITAPYKKAVLWCYENGIAKGYSNRTFRDTQYCTRGQAIYMAFRSQDCPRLYMPTQGNFSAVTSSTYYSGNEIRPAFEIYLRNSLLINGTDYETKYINNSLPGTAAVIVQGTTEAWAGSIRRLFSIVLKEPSINSLTSSRNGQMEVSWSESPHASGYEIKYSNGITAKTMDVKGQTLSKTITGVTKKTHYSVSLRSYILVNGIKYYSSWSDPKTVTTRNAYWKITQYASTTGNQCMAYSITDSNGRLIMVDGGWEQDADRIRSIVQAHGNHVYAWIVTHAHPDHVGALNAILSNNRTGIKIDHIYTAKVNETRYIETHKDYDHIEAYYKFRDLTSGMTNISRLKEGDSFSAIGLNFRVLHAWDQNVDALKTNLCNSGSLMFMMSGEQERMLFCADTEKDVQEDILSRHKDELSATYVQTAHHGNWGLTKDFYGYVHAKVAFFDSPTYITSDRTGKYDAPALIQYMKSQGTRVYLLAAAPQTITMY